MSIRRSYGGCVSRPDICIIDEQKAVLLGNDDIKSLVLSGETLYEIQQRLLKEREIKIRLALERLRKKRHLLRSQRRHREFPVVSVLGYTNCGERLET